MVLAGYLSAVLTPLVILLKLLSYGVGWYLNVVLTQLLSYGVGWYLSVVLSPLVILFMLLWW